MADVYSSPPSHNKQNMRRTAPSGASSRIPLSSDVDKIERFPSAPQPSRLQQLQANFQYKVMKEKEAKMIDMYERQQYQALQRITKNNTQKGIVRDFFRTRRMIEQGAIKSEIPTRDDHFNRMKSEMQQQREADIRQDLSKMHSREDLSRRPPVGLDRAKPLAPLKHRSTVHNMNISEHKFTSKDNYPNEHYSNASQVVLSKKKLTKTNSSHKLPKRYSQRNVDESSSSSSDEGHYSSSRQPQSKDTRTNQRWEQNPIEKKSVFVGNKKKVISEIKEDFPSFKRKDVPPPRREEKLSDFQKWQMEQDLEREQRLSKLRKQTVLDENTFDYDEQSEETDWRRTKNEVKKKKKQGGNKNNRNEENNRQKQVDLIKQKEKELQEIIAKQEAELKQIKDSYFSDDDGTPRELNESMNRKKPQNKKPSKKSVERADNIYEPTPQKAKKPDRGRRPSIKDNTTKTYQQQSQEYEEDQMNFDRNDFGYDIAGALEESDQVVPVNLKACSECGRKFAADRLAKHIIICRKSSKKKRKVFDMTKQRTVGTEQAQFVQNGQHLRERPMPKKSNWKRQHEDFVRTVRDARSVQAHIAKGGKASDLPPPPPSDNSDYKQCPYCKRRFNPSTAERHIPKCKDIKSRPKPPKKR